MGLYMGYIGVIWGLYGGLRRLLLVRCQQPLSARGCRSHQAACGLLPSPFGLGGGKERIQRSMESKLQRKVLLWATVGDAAI